MKRRRYDTVELVAELRRERRNGVLLTLAALGIVAFLATFYFVGRDGGDVPEVPRTSEMPPAPRPEPKPVVPPPPTPTPPQPVPSTVVIDVSRKMPLWLDDTALGKTKRHVQKLDEGTHMIKTKVGRKVVSESFEVEGGKSYTIGFDAKRKRFVVSAGD